MKRAQQNDLVTFANQSGTWEVLAAVNGSKADIRRRGGFDTRVVTAPLESLKRRATRREPGL
jgi:hypothetical protein